MTSPIAINVGQLNIGTLSFNTEEDYKNWLADPDFNAVVWTQTETSFSKPPSGDFSDVDYISVSKEHCYFPEVYLQSCQDEDTKPTVQGFYDFIADDVMADFDTSVGSLQHHVVYKTEP